MGTTSARETYIELLNKQASKFPPPGVHVLVPLRCVVPEENKQRVEAASRWLESGGTIVQPHCSDTKAEARWILSLCVEATGWQSISVITNAYHMPRALLTWIRARNAICDGVEMIVVYPTQLPDYYCTGHFHQEDVKITAYQAKGDVASYEEGVEYLQWLSALKN